jgi:hypothetical protein
LQALMGWSPMVALGSTVLDRADGSALVNRADRHALALHRALGFAGSAAIVVGGLLAGVLPVSTTSLLDLLDLGSATVVPVLVVYAGLTMLLIAWWRIGASLSRPDAPSRRALTITAGFWSAPFALTMPIFSGDVYSYLAQGAMTISGLDPYRVGPAALGGPLAANVPDIWQYTPAPYGPVFLGFAGSVIKVTGNGVWAGIVGMRLLAVAAVVLLLWSVPRLAEFCGVRPASAIWLGVLNPLVLLHLVGDAHNDALMLALMTFGVTLALQRRPVAGTMIVTLAVLVKAPAAAALGFLIPIWADQLDGQARWIRAAQRVLAVAAVTAVTITAFGGTGFGWIRTLDTPTHARTWMSLTTDLGYLFGTLAHWVSGASVDDVRRVFWLAGLVVAAVAALFLVAYSRRLGPVLALGVCLTVLVVAGPVVHPWYLLWAVVPLAAAASSILIRRIVAVGSVGLVLLVLPGGVKPGVAALVGAVLGAGSVFAVSTLLIRWNGRRPPAPLAAEALVPEQSPAS